MEQEMTRQQSSERRVRSRIRVLAIRPMRLWSRSPSGLLQRGWAVDTMWSPHDEAGKGIRARSGSIRMTFAASSWHPAG